MDKNREPVSQNPDDVDNLRVRKITTIHAQGEPTPKAEQERTEAEIAQVEQVGEAGLEAADVEAPGVFKPGDEVKVARNVYDAEGKPTGEKTAPEPGWNVIMMQGNRVLVGNKSGDQKGVKLSDLEAWNQPAETAPANDVSNLRITRQELQDYRRQQQEAGTVAGAQEAVDRVIPNLKEMMSGEKSLAEQKSELLSSVPDPDRVRAYAEAAYKESRGEGYKDAAQAIYDSLSSEAKRLLPKSVKSVAEKYADLYWQERQPK